MSTPEECVILDIPEGLRLNLLGLIVEIGRIRIVADRAGLLGRILASLTCGGIEAAERLEALAQMVRAQRARMEAEARHNRNRPRGPRAAISRENARRRPNQRVRDN